MSQVETAVDSSVVSVYPDHGSAEAALRRLIEAGLAMKEIGRASCRERVLVAV